MSEVLHDKVPSGAAREARAGYQAVERDEGLCYQPRIYVASLSDYNAGRLVGGWLEADDDLEVLTGTVEALLADSPNPGAEEWAIHDYDGFAGLRLDEHEPLATVQRLARGAAGRRGLTRLRRVARPRRGRRSRLPAAVPRQLGQRNRVRGKPA